VIKGFRIRRKEVLNKKGIENRLRSLRIRCINKKKGNKILQSCKPLAEYSEFVEAVRRNIERDKEHGFENAIKKTGAAWNHGHPCPF